MRCLCVATEFPWPLAHGTYLRIYHLARTLAGQGHDVTLLAPACKADGAAAYANVGVTVLAPPTLCPTAADDAPTTEPYASDPAMAAAVATRAGDCDAVILFRPAALQYARQARSAGAVVADFIDDPLLEHRRKLTADYRPRRLLRRLAFSPRQRRYERRFVPMIDVATFVSNADAENFAARHRRRHARAAVVPNGVDLDYFAPPTGAPDSTDAPPNIAFLGHLSHPPNADAAAFLLRRVAPLIHQARPDATITIIGSSPPPELRALAGPNVEITGWVDDVRPYLWAATVVMLPMRMGTGIKNKLLEAWAARRPVVATALACQGVPANDGDNLLTANTPRRLADAAIELIGQPELRCRVSQAGLETIRDNLTWPAATDRLTELIAVDDELAERPVAATQRHSA